MSRFQAIRGKLELITRDALRAGGIQNVIFDNTAQTPPALPFAIVTVSFGSTIAVSFGCAAEKVSGSMAVGIFTPLGRGSTEAEDVAAAVLRAWVELNRDFSAPVRLRTYNHDGPITFDPGGLSQSVRGVGVDPYSMHTLNCGFLART